MKRLWSKSDRRGVILPLTALFIVFIVGMAAVAIDCGTITLARTQLQAAADAAALAGADALPTSTTAAITAAQTIAQSNYAGGTHVSLVAPSDIELGTWDKTTSTFTVLTGSAQSGANAVRVTCWLKQSRATGLTLFFAPIWGHTLADVKASAIAIDGPPSCGAFVGLQYVTMSGGSYTDSYNSSTGSYSSGSAGKNGTVCSNGNISLSGSGTIINGDAHPGVGMMESGGSVTGSTTPLTQALTESAVDFGDSATINDNASIPLSHSGKSPLDSRGNFSLQGGDSLTLPAGTYYFTSMSLSGNATVTVTGKTVIYCVGNCNATGGSVTNTTLIPSNLQIYVTGSKCGLSGGSPLYAAVYAPAADTKYTGSADFYGMLVGKSITVSGGSGLHYDQALGGLTGVSSFAQLVQ
jgi:Flp pilus assembly protein TadG